jgi:hypothetical protein
MSRAKTRVKRTAAPNHHPLQWVYRSSWGSGLGINDGALLVEPNGSHPRTNFLYSSALCLERTVILRIAASGEMAACLRPERATMKAFMAARRLTSYLSFVQNPFRLVRSNESLIRSVTWSIGGAHKPSSDTVDDFDHKQETRNFVGRGKAAIVRVELGAVICCLCVGFLVFLV